MSYDSNIPAAIPKQTAEANPYEKVTRFEVIDATGRAYVKYDIQAELSLQDDGRTLKVFIKPNPKS